MKQQRMTGRLLGLLGVMTLSVMGLIGCQWFDHDSPITPTLDYHS